MDCDSPLNNVTKASRKRPFNVGNSSLIGNSNDNSDDILSSFGMKEQDIFKSPQICNPFGQVDSESSESFKVPQTNSTSGQSPYFQVSVSAKSKALQDLSDKDYKNEPKTPKVNNARNIIVPEKDEQQLPNLSQECRIPTAPEEIRKQEEECELKPRSLRPIGEYSTSSLDKEFQDIMQYLKDEREKDQNLFIKCSKGLRSRVSQNPFPFLKAKLNNVLTD